MKRKNFTATPNTFLLDENKSHDVTKLLKNATEKLIVIIMEGLQAKFGREFQKSSKQIANMCLIARSTFITNVDNLINKGVISKRVEKIEGSKESETTYWTVNIELLHDIEVIPNSDKVESELGQGLSQNDIGVIPNSDKGCPNIGQKEDIKDFKDLELKKEEEEYIYNNKPSENNPLIAYWQTELETNSYKEFLTASGFKHDTIKEIITKTATKISKKELSHLDAKNKIVLNDAFKEFNKDKNNDIRSYSGLFVFKLKQTSEKYNINMALQEKELQERALQEEKSWNNPLPIYNYLES